MSPKNPKTKKPNLPKRPTPPACKDCGDPMADIYELDVPIYEKNADTGRRDKHHGYICRECLTTAYCINGKGAMHGKTDNMPKFAHSRMVTMLGRVLKGMRAAKAEKG